MLCALCITLIQGGSRGTRHHKTLSDFLKAAEAGCKICRRLRIYYDEGAGQSLLTNELYIPAICSAQNAMVLFQCASTFGHDKEINFYLHPALDMDSFIRNKGVWPPPSNAHDHFKTEDLLAKADVETQPWKVRDDEEHIEFPANTGDPAVLEFAREWLNTCRNEHTYCIEMSSKHKDSSALSRYPKRLIDLSKLTQTGGEHSSEESSLIETHKHNLQGPYATLSHCWGSKEFLTLTEDNIDDMLIKVPMDQLPKSFRDAITVCVSLRIQYLWIDSLCIIQSKAGINQDWIEHARTIADIYRNCVLNIAIDRASNPFEGAFVDRDTTPLQPGRVDVPCHYHESCFETKWFSTAEEDRISALEKLPLAKRGWSFQERFLSPRILHFGEDRIFWECHQIAMSDVSEPYCHDIGQMSPPFKYPPPDAKYWEAALFRWRDLVAGYTRRLLTKPDQDKLVAFAAIAQAVEKQSKTDYVAGILRGSLPKSLLWSASLGDRKTTRPKGYRAPSWSWANTDSECSLYFDYNGSKSYSDVLDIDMKYTDPENRYGMVESGIITIEGPVATFEWEELPDHGPTITSISGTSTVKEARSSDLWVDFDFDDDFRTFRDREKIVMRIRPTAGLMLVKTEAEDIYVRVGVFYCRIEGLSPGDMPPHIAGRFEPRVIKIV